MRGSGCLSTSFPRRRVVSGYAAGLLALLMGALAPIATAGEIPGGGDGRRPNILLVAVDTLRRDHCSAYGYGKPTTPQLEKLAAEGVKFENHFSGGPWTTPSLATLFTGRSAAAHGLDSVRKRFPDNLPTLAEQMRAAGYYTLGVVCNPCAAGRLGFSRGFDCYDDFTISLDLEMNLFGGARPVRFTHQVVTGALTSKLLLKHLATRPKDKPWFAFVLYFDPHLNYAPDERYRRMFSDTPADEPAPPAEWLANSPELTEAVACYGGEIRQTDDEIAVLLERLRAAGHFSDNDLLVWTADHGEEFRDHGGLLHGNTYFDELIRAPLVLRWPGKLPAGTTVSGMTAHEDLAAALLSAAGAANDTWPQPAADLLALARGESGKGRAAVGLAGDAGAQDLVAWRTTDWLLAQAGPAGSMQAWHLVNDPGQQHPLDPANHPESRELAKALDAWRRSETASRGARGQPPAATLTAKEKAALKALGYLQD